MKASILAPNGRLARAEIFARYEAAQVHRGNRSFITFGRMSADKDLRAAGGTLCDKARYLWKNSPIIRGLIERMVTLVVGTGLNPIPASSNPEWNKRAKRRWKEISRHIELATGAPWGEVCQILYRAQLVDGEQFAHLVLDDYGKPRTQLIEAHYCPFGEDTAAGTLDGLKLDRFKRPVSYVFRADEGAGAKSYPLSPEVVVHFVRRSRACQHRGETLLAAAINAAHDVDDILALEKAAVKGHSAIKDIIKTASGEVTQEDLVANGDAQTDPANSIKYYRDLFGPESMVMKRGDEYTPFVSGRPSPAWQGFMDFLCQTIVMAANMPPSVLLPVKNGSADNRRDLAMAARVVEQNQWSMIPRLHRLYVHTMEPEVEDGPLVGAPSDWRECAWQCPRTATIDAGREANSDREDFLVGLDNKRRLLGEWGLDWDEEEAQTEVEVRSLINRAKAIAADAGIEFNVVLNLLSKRDPNAMSAAQGKPAGKPKKEDDDA